MKRLEEFKEEAATVAPLFGTLCRDSSLVMPLREGLHAMMQCYRRPHFAAGNDLREHPRGHSSWRESTRMKFVNIQMGVLKDAIGTE